MIYWISYFFLKILSYIYFPTTYSGTENLPRGSFVVASNHVSNLDPFLLGMCKLRRFSYLAKEELFKTKASAFLYHQLGAFPIKREEADFRAVRETLRRLKHGCPVIIFPEGTRRVEQRRKRVESGVGFIVAKSKVPVVPAWIEGADKSLPIGAKFFKRHSVKIVFGKPLSFSSDQFHDTIAHQIMDAIEALKVKV